MAKNKGDLILRDRLRFNVDGNGNVPVVYGRIDLSDYVNVVRDEGLHIKEITYQLRRTGGGGNSCAFDPKLSIGQEPNASLMVFASTTAYESALDVGVASPNVLNVMTLTRSDDLISSGGTDTAVWALQEKFRGVYDLHPEGYTVVTDLLIGIAADNCTLYKSEAVEIDVMIIAEPKKVTKDDLEKMLAQATDL